MQTSARGRRMIAGREGLRLSAYRDSAGILTIGHGHTSAAGPPFVTPGLIIDRREAARILDRDLTLFEQTVSATITAPLTQNQFDALVSLAFNIGATAFAASTLAARLNEGRADLAAEQFLAWNKATINGRKQVMRGLTLRRHDERRQFLTPGKAAARSQTAMETRLPPRLLARLWQRLWRRLTTLLTQKEM